MRVTALAGGTGAAKLVRGLACQLAHSDLTVIGNTGDDVEIWGLSVSPDLDTLTYALAGRLDVARGWGLTGETFRCLEAMVDLGAETWFNLGDRDLATHLVRTRLLREGIPLSGVTAEIARRFGSPARILPMSDHPVRTRVLTPGGWLSFQEYFVREKAMVEVLDVEYAGAATARAAPGVLDSLRDADLIIVCPSNPVTSVGPILAVPGIREALQAARAPRVAVSPIIGDAPVSGPAGALMRARGLAVSPLGVAAAYCPWLTALAIDESDRARAEQLQEAGVMPIVAPILMTDREREVDLARRILGERALVIGVAVPVKDLCSAKQRLVPVLDPAERADLARAMLRDVLGALVGARLDVVWVVTRDAAVMAIARALGAEVLAEAANEGHTAAVAHAQAHAARRGLRVFATIPGDVPCVTPDDARALVEAAGPAPGAVFAPSRSGLGTNGAALSPPAVMPLTFGEPSFDNHLAAARRLGLIPRVLDLPGLGLDVDAPDDLRALLDTGAGTESGRLLATWSIAERLGLERPVRARRTP